MEISKEATDLITAVASALLVLATLALVVATFRLVKQTRNLAEITHTEMANQAKLTENAAREGARLTEQVSSNDLTQRKRLATYDGWTRLRDRLTHLHGANGAVSRDVLREFEYFAAGVQRQVFDREMIIEMSGSWILERIRSVRPYINQARERRQDRPDYYAKILWLESEIKEHQTTHPPTTEEC